MSSRGEDLCFFISSKKIKSLLKRTNNCRQAARDFCGDIDIPLNDTMAMLDTDYASEAWTCESDRDILDSTVERHMKAGLGQTAKKACGFDWRSPDVSQGYILFLYSKLTCLFSMSPFFTGWRLSLSVNRLMMLMWDPKHTLNLLPGRGDMSPQRSAGPLKRILTHLPPPYWTIHPCHRRARRLS